MTKFNLALWSPNKTIMENALRMKICYNYAAELARKNLLPYIRKRIIPVSLDLSPSKYLEPLKFSEDIQSSEDQYIPYKSLNQVQSNFAGEGPD